MLASQLFYSQLVLKNIEPYLRNINSINSSFDINNFPLLLTRTKYKAEDFKFYQKYLVPNLHTHCFTKVLDALSKPSIQEIDQFSDAIEPALVKRIKNVLLAKKSYLDLTSVSIKSTKVISKNVFKGVFMHRVLNMPKQCYSVEKKSQEDIIFRMRTKMTREQHIGLLMQKQKIYNQNNYKLEKYYLDGYENFVQNEQVSRMLVEINAEIKGKIITPQKEEIKLPLDEDKPITTHLIQIESIKVPSRVSTETSLVTDIDYFMQGNPYSA